MTDDEFPEIQMKPSAPFKLSKWLVSGVVTTSLICGTIAAVAVLLLADGVMDVGDDPVIPAEEIQQNVARVDARVAELEKRVSQIPQQQDASALSGEIKSEVAALEKKVDEMKTVATESRAGQIVLAVSQIKNAYEHDLPMQPGIDLLKKSVVTPGIQQKLDELSAMVGNPFPTKSELEREAEAFAKNENNGNVFNADQGPDSSSVSFTDRLKGLMGRFVKIESVDTGATRVTSSGLSSALARDDLPVAHDLVSKLPASPVVQSLARKIDARLQVQTKVQEVVNSVMQMAAPSTGGALY
jgi:hypothetical protein